MSSPMRLGRTLKHLYRSILLRPTAVILVAAIFTAVLLVWSFAGGLFWKERLLVLELQRDQGKLRELQDKWNGGSIPDSGIIISNDPLLRRGIVICAGGRQLLANTFVSVHVLRKVLNSTLPIEIFHNGPADLPPRSVAAFEVFRDVTFVDLSAVPWPHHGSRPALFNGYVQKVLSLYATQFSQVLLLDADSQPLMDPAALFETPAFQESGNLFWSDFWGKGSSESPQEVVYRWLGLEAPWTYRKHWQCAESGQVFFDRARHADVLEWLWFLNSHARLLYRHMLGDKDTFEMAFMLAGKEGQYARVPHEPGLATSSLQSDVQNQDFFIEHFGPRTPKAEARRYLRLAMLQFDPSGRPSFMHRTERTKFGAQRGYSLQTMRPVFWTPPISVAKAVQIRDQAWNTHSIPEGLADVNCSCCILVANAAAVVKQTGWEPPASRGGGDVCEWKLPLFPISWLGPKFQAAIDGGFEGFRQFAGTVPGVRLQG